MRIKRDQHRWWLYEEGIQDVPLTDIIEVDGAYYGLYIIYNDLLYKELGSYDYIIGKTFELDNNGVAVLSKSFYKYIQNERDIEQKEIQERIQQQLIESRAKQKQRQDRQRQDIFRRYF